MGLEVLYQQPKQLKPVLIGGAPFSGGRATILFPPYISPKKKILLQSQEMSRRDGAKLELKLNLSPPRSNQRIESPRRSASPISPPSSCVSSEANSPEVSSMILVGCPKCLMYVMISEEDPKCPKCKSTVLLDVMRENADYRNRHHQQHKN